MYIKTDQNVLLVRGRKQRDGTRMNILAYKHAEGFEQKKLLTKRLFKNDQIKQNDLRESRLKSRNRILQISIRYTEAKRKASAY